MPMALLPDLGVRPLVMGILNVTPDSFSDDGRFATLDVAIAHADTLVDEGADILDIGGESTRPGATEVPCEEEISRVVPVIKAITERHGLPISIDSYKARTAQAALQAGARIVNDVWGLQREPDIARVAADHRAPVIIMHNRPVINAEVDILADMRDWFARSLEIAHRAGIPDEHIILDPGIGFGKTFEQNLDALVRLPEVKALGYPVLVGTSRKSLIGLLSDRPLLPRDRLNGTIASNTAAILLGADIIRVHDVRAHADAARVAEAVRMRMTQKGRAGK